MIIVAPVPAPLGSVSRHDPKDIIAHHNLAPYLIAIRRGFRVPDIVDK